MPLPQSIPSKLNLERNIFIDIPQPQPWPPKPQYNNIYITAVLYSGPIVIDGKESDFSALSFASPIGCKSFTGGLAQVAYYIQ
jgi:hypothetical protein